MASHVVILTIIGVTWAFYPETVAREAGISDASGMHWIAGLIMFAFAAFTLHGRIVSYGMLAACGIVPASMIALVWYAGGGILTEQTLFPSIVALVGITATTWSFMAFRMRV